MSFDLILSDLNNRVKRFRDAADRVEELAEELGCDIAPVDCVVRAVAEIPFDEREEWASGVTALVGIMPKESLQDVLDEWSKAPRWGIAFDGGNPAKAFAGAAFGLLLSTVHTNPNAPGTFFATLDACPYPRDEMKREIRLCLGHILYKHVDRAVRRNLKDAVAVLQSVNATTDTLPNHLNNYTITLSDTARGAINLWGQCLTGLPCYPIELPPEREAGTSESAPPEVSTPATGVKPEELPSNPAADVAPHPVAEELNPSTTGDDEHTELRQVVTDAVKAALLDPKLQPLKEQPVPKVEELPRAPRLAIQQYRQASNALREGDAEPTDQSAFDYLASEGVELPAFETWTKNLRRARSTLGIRKHEPRAATRAAPETRSAVPRSHFGETG